MTIRSSPETSMIIPERILTILDKNGFVFSIVIISTLVYIIPQLSRPQQITKVELSLEFNHLWIKVKKFSDGTIQDRTHTYYICPVCISGIPCTTVLRNDYPGVRVHKCKLKNHPTTLTQYHHRTLQHTMTNVEQICIQEAVQMQSKRQYTNPSDIDYELLESLVEVISKANISFFSVSSNQFRKLLRILISRVLPSTVSIPTNLFSSLHYRNVVEMITIIAKRKHELLRDELQNQSITIMMDGATIGNHKLTAITLLQNTSSSKPLFLRFEPECSNE